MSDHWIHRPIMGGYQYRLPSGLIVPYDDERAVWVREKLALEKRIQKTKSERKREEYWAQLNHLLANRPRLPVD